MAKTDVSTEKPDGESTPEEATPLGFERGPVGQFLDVLIRRREASITIVAVGLILYFAATTPAFTTEANLRVLSQFTAAIAILACGIVFVLITGQIDLSIGHVFALAPIVMHFAMEAGIPFLIAIPLALIASAAIGLINGAIHVFIGVPSFVVTLGMLFLLNGFTLTISGGFPRQAPRDEPLIAIFGAHPFAGIIWAIIFAVVLHSILTNTRWGTYTFAVGGNPTAAKEAGIKVEVIKIGNFVMVSTLAGFAGIIEAIRLTTMNPLAGGEQIMFFAIASAVIGGTALAGGTGTVAGAFLGALVLGVLRDGFTLQGISAFIFNMILGGAILIAMVANVQMGARRRGAKVE